jgi:dTDP-4-dehydrorhamnose 3,5-epimerase
MPFAFQETDVPGLIVIEPKIFADQRGYFLESYKKSDFAAAGIGTDFVQENHSKSLHGTLRGLHGQRTPKAQGKLVRVVEGAIYDVAVDVRRDSPMFGRWVSVMLSAENRKAVYVPPGCLHGFCVLSPVAQVIYKTTAEYDPQLEYGVRWDDGTLAIDWPVASPRLSERDRNWPSFDMILRVGLQAT